MRIYIYPINLNTVLVRVDSIAVSLFVFTYNQHSPIYDVAPVENHNFEKPSIRLGAGVLVYWVSHFTFSLDELMKILLNMALPVIKQGRVGKVVNVIIW